MKRPLLLCLGLLAPLASPAAGEEPAGLEGVAFEQRLDAQVPLDLSFFDEEGRSVRLAEYFGDEPVILALVYYECPMLCTLVLNGLVGSLKALSFDVGEQFEVVTVSFDPQETPALAKAKKETYLGSYRRPGAAEGWHFLTGDAASIEALSSAVGFHFRYDPQRDEFAHAAGITVLTPSGRIARYFYGVEYPPRDLRLGLIEAADERIGGVVDQLMLYCFRYDVNTGQYSAAVMNLVRLGGILTVAGFAGFVISSRRKENHR